METREPPGAHRSSGLEACGPPRTPASAADCSWPPDRSAATSRDMTSGTRRSKHHMPIIPPEPRHIGAGQQLAVAGGPGMPARLAAPHLGEVEAVGGVDAATDRKSVV